jgi:two-component system, LytTR family, response regulator LytT
MNILIVEDELIVVEHLKLVLSQIGNFHISHVKTEEEAKTRILNSPPDCCFLDIRLSKRNEGISIAEWINIHQPLPFVFISAHSDLATLKSAINTEPITYITKPFKNTDIVAAVQMMIASLEKKSNFIILKDGNAERRINTKSIYYIQSDKNYIDFVGEFGKITVRNSMKWAEANLPESKFVRVHKSFLINIEKIEVVQNNSITVSKQKIPISRNFSIDELKG